MTCPFCLHSVTETRSFEEGPDGDTYWHETCLNCDATGPTSISEAGARALWDTREHRHIFEDLGEGAYKVCVCGEKMRRTYPKRG